MAAHVINDSVKQFGIVVYGSWTLDAKATQRITALAANIISNHRDEDEDDHDM